MVSFKIKNVSFDSMDIHLAKNLFFPGILLILKRGKSSTIDKLENTVTSYQTVIKND
jgi:hypothetical protein